MNEADTQASSHRPQWADDELAQLERAMESAHSDHGSEKISLLFQEHKDAYQRIDQLTKPIRSAITSVDEPPSLPDYEALRELGRGGMGIVYCGFHRKTQRQEAIKVIRRDRLAGMSRDTVKLIQLQFEQESKLAARVAHEHIVPIYQVGAVDDQPWFSMQLVEGNDLRALSRGSGIAPERAARYIEAIARAVDVVHRHGIIHGDIKPHNIMVDRETDRPMLTDFGLADFEARYSSGALGGVAGTSAYMAPELARAALEGAAPDEVAAVRSVAADIYSLGATLWSALTGLSPCEDGRSVRQHFNDVANGKLEFKRNSDDKIPTPILRVIDKCLTPDPAARYSTAADLADDLSSWLARPHWNRYFPGLRSLLWTVVAPMLLLSGIGVWWLSQAGAHEGWIWLIIFGGYGPLFATFLASGPTSRAGQQASRELWSIWMGHLVSTFVCMVALRILCNPDFGRTLEFFYPCWAAISSLLFFAKSGNFWTFYRLIAFGWAIAAVLLTIAPFPPIAFSLFAAMTCAIIAKGENAFLEK